MADPAAPPAAPVPPVAGNSGVVGSVPPQARAVRSPPLKATERERNVNARGEGSFMTLMSYRIPGRSQFDRTAGLAELTRYYLSPNGSARARLARRLVRERFPFVHRSPAAVME